MKVTITALKAPWPAGAGVGAVVDLVGRAAIPDWALGKCAPAADDAPAQFELAPSAPTDTAAPPAAAPVADQFAEIEAQAARERPTKAKAKG